MWISLREMQLQPVKRMILYRFQIDHAHLLIWIKERESRSRKVVQVTAPRYLPKTTTLSKAHSWKNLAPYVKLLTLNHIRMIPWSHLNLRAVISKVLTRLKLNRILEFQISSTRKESRKYQSSKWGIIKISRVEIYFKM
mgnify:FL=1